jgi:hypothetical protein
MKKRKAERCQKVSNPATTFMLQPPSFPIPLPACFYWKEGDPLPEGLTFVNGPIPRAMSLKVCLVQMSPPKITIEKQNIAEIDIDVKTSWKWAFKQIATNPEVSGRISEPPEEWSQKEKLRFQMRRQ